MSISIDLSFENERNRLATPFHLFPCHRSQVGFAEFNNTADNRPNIGGTIIGAPIVGQ